MNLTSLNDFPRPQTISPGDHILYEEDVFKKHEGKNVHAGKRRVAVVIIGPGIPGNSLVGILKCQGINAFPEGVKIQKPTANLLRGFLINEYSGELVLKSGGHLEGIKDGKKVALDSADQGGMSVGSTHATGGIKGSVAGDKSIEFENKEAVLTSKINSDQNTYDFNGKKMSARQIASEINVANGGKAFAGGGDTGTEAHPVKFTGGEIILTAPVSSDTRMYDFNGKKMSAVEIASCLNQKNGGVAFSDGGQPCPCEH